MAAEAAAAAAALAGLPAGREAVLRVRVVVENGAQLLSLQRLLRDGFPCNAGRLELVRAASAFGSSRPLPMGTATKQRLRHYGRHCCASHRHLRLVHATA